MPLSRRERGARGAREERATDRRSLTHIGSDLCSDSDSERAGQWSCVSGEYSPSDHFTAPDVGIPARTVNYMLKWVRLTGHGALWRENVSAEESEDWSRVEGWVFEFLLWCSCRFHLITYIISNVYVVIFVACLSTSRLSFSLSFIWCLFFRGLIVHSLIHVFRMLFEQFCTAYNVCYVILLVKFSSIWTYSYYIWPFYIIYSYYNKVQRLFVIHDSDGIGISNVMIHLVDSDSS